MDKASNLGIFDSLFDEEDSVDEESLEQTHNADEPVSNDEPEDHGSSVHASRRNTQDAETEQHSKVWKFHTAADVARSFKFNIFFAFFLFWKNCSKK